MLLVDNICLKHCFSNTKYLIIVLCFALTNLIENDISYLSTNIDNLYCYRDLMIKGDQQSIMMGAINVTTISIQNICFYKATHYFF